MWCDMDLTAFFSEPTRHCKEGLTLHSSHATDVFTDIYGFGKNTRKAAAYHQFPTKFSYSTHNAVDRAMHLRKRKLVKQAFSAAAMGIWLTSVLCHVRIFCSELGGDSASPSGAHSKWSAPKSMSDYCLYLMSDIVSDAVFHQPFSTLTSADNRYILHLVHRTYEWIGIIFQAPKLAKYGLDHYLIRGLALDRQKLRTIFGGLLRQRMANPPEEEDILSVYMDYLDPDTGKPFPTGEIGAEALLLFGAGPDATSTSLASAFFYLVRNPEGYSKVFAEVRSTFACDKDIVPGHKLSGCVYLRACLDEAMRMNPVNGGALWREVLCGGAIIDGHNIPAGVDVGVGIYSIHHQADYYPQPWQFRPERWIASDGNSAAAVARARSAWSPFSMGPRGCVGKTLAIMQLSISLAMVLFLYDMRTPADPALARVGGGVKGKRFPRNLESEYQAKGTFSSILRGPMIEFRKRERS
ncbi:benzoate 4-monooxygenase cytochrome P450 [Pyrenochaeta sp. MPI-SDFR-AT-0127]|nr:benzoate 4-monooxygenase cytochrome P450 [Pyrenochaeta sp. MPI-SDFR-AT-0127]